MWLGYRDEVVEACGTVLHPLLSPQGGSPVRKSLSVILVAVLAWSLTPGVAQAAYEPPSGGTFNVPRPWGNTAEKYRIVSTVEKAMNKAQGPTAAYPDPTIHVSTYLLDRRQSVDAMIAACRRGVAVRVILDRDVVNRQSKRLIKVLSGDDVKRRADGTYTRPRSGPCNRPLPGQRRVDTGPLTDAEALARVAAPTAASPTWGGDGSYVKRCKGSCRGGGGNMHSKFYLFSRTGASENVVMVSSSNLNRGGALLGWNDMYVMKNRPASWNKYVQIHRDMTEDNRAGVRKVEIKDGPYTSRFFPMRRASRANDPTLEDLKKIGCRSAYGRTKVHVSMFFWKGSRGDYLADKLLSLARNGCRVSIIYGAPSVDIATRLRAAAGRNLIDLFDSRWDFNNDGYNEIRTHAKYVIVKGAFGGDRSHHIVMTGSQNWVSGSLSRGDETTLNVELRGAWSQYMRNWNAIRNHSRRLPYNR